MFYSIQKYILPYILKLKYFKYILFYICHLYCFTFKDFKFIFLPLKYLLKYILVYESCKNL